MDSLLSDIDSFSESSSSDDQDDIESLYHGHALSIFSSLEESIEKIDDFLMFERNFVPGDIVSLVSDRLGKMGKVINIDMVVDLENIYGRKIRNVGSKNLQKIRSLLIGDYVVCGAWLGKVEKIVDIVTILFDDGTKCKLSDVGPDKIVAISQDLIEDSQYPFYPGQRVKVESPSLSKVHWLCGPRKGKIDHGTVCKVEAGLVNVHWIGCGVSNSEKEEDPSCFQDSKNLSVLPSFPHANWQLGDWCVTGRNLLEVAVIVKTKSTVDVMWQDGSQSMGLDSNALFAVNFVDTHDFLPDSFVLVKGAIDDSRVLEVPRWGYIRCVDPKERTVAVRWCDSFKDVLDSGKEQMEEIVSAYELVEHPDYSYCIGEPVFRTDDSCDETDQGDKFLSRIGIVVGFKNGDVEVKWATGATSKVAPYEIYRVDKSEGATGLSEENAQHSNEELSVKENQLLGQNEKDGSRLNYDDAEHSSPLSLSRVAIGVFTSFTSSLFGSISSSLASANRCTPENGQILSEPSEEEALELSNWKSGVQDVLMMPEKTTLEHIKEADDITLPRGSKSKESYRQFDMVNDCSDHHFFNGSGTGLESQMKRGWLKKVHQEWSLLEKDLSQNIYVRVYEERMDLVRAAIVGTAGTPYHDGLFFFDIHLPPQYPNEPPMVHYNSGGLRLNPNLYESGKVCLSLLNTWAGSSSEIWNPESSTILQVLLSIQALVLNEKPYFNEAGYDSQIGNVLGEKNSISYNENAFLVSCRSMLYLLRKPPKHFEALVDVHFSSRCKDILLACKAYMQGAPVGCPFQCMNSEQENHEGNSTGFKIMLRKLFARLEEAFSEKGFDCTNL